MQTRPRWRLATLPLVLLAALVAASGATAAGPKGKTNSRPGYDVNATGAAKSELRARASGLAARPSAAVRELRDRLGREGVLRLYPLTGTPSVVAKLDGSLTPPSGASAEAIARDYLAAKATIFRLGRSTLTLARAFTDSHGLRHLRFVQTLDGIPVLNGGVRVNIAADGRIVNVVGSPVTIIADSAGSPSVSAEAALATALRDVGASVVPFTARRSGDARRTTEFAGGARAALGLYNTTEGLRLAWETFVTSPTGLTRGIVDGDTGAVLLRKPLTQDSTGLAFDNYPGAAAGGTQTSYDLTGRGWLPVGAKYLEGPNTHVFADLNDNNVADQAEEINPSTIARSARDWRWPLLRFFPPVAGCDVWVCTWEPEHAGSWAKNEDQSGQQLFVLVNKFHDHLETPAIGFDESAGNFEGDDPVLGHALDGAKTAGNYPDGGHIDNANFGTPPDGQSPIMQMFLFHQPFAGAGDPYIAADGSNDAGIVYHEYTHGLSNRLVVDSLGNSTLNSLQAGAMGEAWSDWYAYDYLANDGFQADAPGVADVRVGHYVGGGLDLVRTEPLDCTPTMTAAQACPGGVATGEGGYTYGDMSKIIGIPEVHADGEIWGQTLWQIRGVLGTATTQSLVTEGMMLSPDDPTMLDMRNAILQADVELFAGSHVATLWAQFASRGMGYFAGAIDGSDFTPVESFALPPAAGGPTGSLGGTVTDRGTGLPLANADVAFGGHDSGVGPAEIAIGHSDAAGAYSISGIPFGTYPKVSVFAAGYDREVDTITVDGAENRNWSVRRDWISGLAGATITSFTGADFSQFFCGPDKAIDQTGNGWINFTDLIGGPKSLTVQLPNAVDISDFGVDPSHPCGVGGSASVAGYSIETSPDGTTWTVAASGTFTAADRYRLNTVTPTADATGVRFVRFTMISPQVPGGTAASCPGGFAGCTYMGMTELVVHGAPTP